MSESEGKRRSREKVEAEKRLPRRERRDRLLEEFERSADNLTVLEASVMDSVTTPLKLADLKLLIDLLRGSKLCTFRILDEESKRIKEWQEEHDKVCPYACPSNQGAIGGRLSYSFTPTSIGMATTVTCACGEEKNVTDYDAW